MSELPPREFLERAYNRLKRPDWGSLDDALNHPVRCNLIHGLARSIQRGSSPVPQENPRSFAPRTVHSPPLRPMPLDRKRLASGEKEDEE